MSEKNAKILIELGKTYKTTNCELVKAVAFHYEWTNCFVGEFLCSDSIEYVSIDSVDFASKSVD